MDEQEVSELKEIGAAAGPDPNTEHQAIQRSQSLRRSRTNTGPRKHCLTLIWLHGHDHLSIYPREVVDGVSVVLSCTKTTTTHS